MTWRRSRARRPSGHRLSVDNDRCRGYGFCQAEAPDLFRLAPDGGLRYRREVTPEQLDEARSAVRHCPMLAIALEVRT